MRTVQQECTTYGGGVWWFPGVGPDELNLWSSRLVGCFINDEVWVLEDRSIGEFLGFFRVSNNYKRAMRRRKKGFGVNPNRNYQSIRIM